MLHGSVRELSMSSRSAHTHAHTPGKTWIVRCARRWLASRRVVLWILYPSLFGRVIDEQRKGRLSAV